MIVCRKYNYIIILLDNRAGFCKGRSVINNVFVLKPIIENRIECDLETHLTCVDYERAFIYKYKSNN